MTGFLRYTDEMEAFKKSRTFTRYYNKFLDIMQGVDISAPMKRKVIGINIGLKDVRKISILIKYARYAGVPIGANEDGLFYARSYLEAEATITRLNEEANSILMSSKALISCFNDVELEDSEKTPRNKQNGGKFATSIEEHLTGPKKIGCLKSALKWLRKKGS